MEKSVPKVRHEHSDFNLIATGSALLGGMAISAFGFKSGDLHYLEVGTLLFSTGLILGAVSELPDKDSQTLTNTDLPVNTGENLL
ncbi:MAG: hypothetical protein NVS1B7_4500 [Candidatus Saccharimonadales bacterium]